MNFSDAVKLISENNQEPGWLKDLRLEGLNSYEGLPKPSSQTDEEWRRTDAAKIIFSGFEPESAKAFELNFRAPDPSVVFCSLTEASKKFPDLVRPYLEKTREKNQKFAALNQALWNGGIFLYVPKNMKLDVPLSALVEPSLFPRVLIVADENSSLCFLEDERSGIDRTGWVNSVWNVFLKPNSHLSLAQSNRESDKVSLLLNFNAVLEKAATLNLLSVSVGSSLTKSNWNVNLTGEGASVQMFGLVKGAKRQHFDETIYVVHEARNTQSDVLFKTALKDQARSVFSGLIHVKKTAQKTNAYQTNRNLLLSKEARADTIPKLEIEADDVKCGHGASVSSMDEDQLYYMMARGLTREDAEAMIIQGFYEDVINRWIAGAPLRAKEEIFRKICNDLLGMKEVGV